jgi:ATP-dependent protease ClpP protease subunit
VIATGEVSSSAMLVLLAASTRIATPHTRFMVHPVKSSEADEATLKERDFIHSTIRDILSTRTKLTQIEAAGLMSECSVFGTEFAKQVGIISGAENTVGAL